MADHKPDQHDPCGCFRRGGEVTWCDQHRAGAEGLDAWVEEVNHKVDAALARRRLVREHFDRGTVPPPETGPTV